MKTTLEFPHETPAKLVLFLKECRELTEGFLWVPKHDATQDDLVRCAVEFDAKTRESMARAICPELARRLDTAEHIIEHVIDAGGAIMRAREYVAAYGDGNFLHSSNAEQVVSSASRKS